jgi:prolactin regulatory element-binding protein
MSRVSYASYDLGYPPWALDFDPYNRGYLLVGGGGGAGQKEVPNRLTLLDVSAREQIDRAAECDVSDDSPSSLGVLASKDGMIAFSGANSSIADRQAGKNEHFRSFKVDFPVKTKGVKQSDGKIEALRKSCLFSSPYAISGDAFQRLLRLSPARKTSVGAKRIGAIANSLIQPSEIVLFDATAASPTQKDVIHRIELPEKTEANDLDIYEVSDGEFLLTYCTSTEVFVCGISYDFAKHKLASKVEAPSSQHKALKAGVKYRSIRFLSKDYILLMTNCGPFSELLVLRVYPKEGPCDVILRKTLANRMKASVSMDVCLLDADLTTGERQAIVALAAQREDIYVLTLNVPAKGSPTSFNTYTNLLGVHKAPMKKVVLSPFFSPYDTSDGQKKEAIKTPGQQFIRLASISLSNNVVVDALPLHAKKTKTTPRYFLEKGSVMSGAVGTGSSLFVLAFAILVTLILAQSYLDQLAAEKGTVAPIQLIPPQIKAFINRQREDSDPLKHIIQEVAEGNIHIPGTGSSLQDLIDLHHKEDPSDPSAKKAIVIAPPQSGSTELHTEVHDDHAAVEEHPKAKRWDELSKKEQGVWKDRLAKAGQWTIGEGEGILKSIFFSEVAGAVGRAVLGG